MACQEDRRPRRAGAGMPCRSTAKVPYPRNRNRTTKVAKNAKVISHAALAGFTARKYGRTGLVSVRPGSRYVYSAPFAVFAVGSMSALDSTSMLDIRARFSYIQRRWPGRGVPCPNKSRACPAKGVSDALSCGPAGPGPAPQHNRRKSRQTRMARSPAPGASGW